MNNKESSKENESPLNSCMICESSSQWVEQRGPKAFAYHPFYACKNAKSSFCGLWLSPWGTCELFEESQKKIDFLKERDKRGIIKPPKKIIRRL